MEDIHECQCAQAGYCEFFKQEMTYDPPNWQWCQGASKSDRDQYKANCDKKHKRREEQNRITKKGTSNALRPLKYWA